MMHDCTSYKLVYHGHNHTTIMIRVAQLPPNLRVCLQLTSCHHALCSESSLSSVTSYAESLRLLGLLESERTSPGCPWTLSKLTGRLLCRMFFSLGICDVPS